MSPIIRDAIIRLKIEQQKAKLEAPDVGNFVRQQQELKKLSEETGKNFEVAAKATAAYSREVEQVANRHHERKSYGSNT